MLCSTAKYKILYLQNKQKITWFIFYNHTYEQTPAHGFFSEKKSQVKNPPLKLLRKLL